MGRPDRTTYFMRMAILTGSRSNCLKRSVGCVLVDFKNTVLSTGYNGVPRGFKHCSKEDCTRIHSSSGNDLALCLAIHAEMNALLTCPDIDKIRKAYITVSPCLTCTVMLLNTSCEEIIFNEFYEGSKKALEIWKARGRSYTVTDIPYEI